MKINLRVGSVCGLALAALAVSGCTQRSMNDGMAMPAGSMQMERMMTNWHPASREAVQYMTNKYGAPAEVTATMAMWNQTGPWKRTIVYAQEVPHHFPMPHPDVMEQFIDYRMPVSMFDDIAMYDGSVIVERTKGEMSARCDKEGANFLAVNLAHEIAIGKRGVEDARQMYGQQIKMMKAGQMTQYTSGLIFTPPPSGNDPGQPIM